MPVQANCRIVGKEKLAAGIYKISIKTKEIAELAKPGHFLEIKVSDSLETFLRRPISIYNIDQENEVVEFIFQVKGKGTELLAERKIGEDLNIVGPLGNGTFSIKPYQKVAILGGGIGIYPLYELAKTLKKTSEVNTYLGFRNKDLVTLEEEFESVSNQLMITTDDGSYQKKGFAIDFLKIDCQKEKPDMIFACRTTSYVKSTSEIFDRK